MDSDKEFIIESLSDYHYKRPSDYIGETYFDHIVVYSHHRDSSILEQSNFIRILEILEKFQTEKDKDNEYLKVSRQNHWAVGWVEFIYVSFDASLKLLMEVYEIIRALENYSIVDENHYSTMQYEAVYNDWETNSLSYRIDLCKQAGVSIFSARRTDDIPDRVLNLLYEVYS